ncbi:maestro heat-like repeat-containing protein family member 7 [Heliangelus exortis]|uniref:maestro heat-like repeat-containing protein family member 7 n=1 Tax=Heliangelus exortis TaxID=472823 RepID=UPI003A90E61D
MECRRPPSQPRRAWEESRTSPSRSSGPRPYETCEVQPLRAAQPARCCSPSAVSGEGETLHTIRAFLGGRPQQKAQKLEFLASVCTVCSTSSPHAAVRVLLQYHQEELVEIIKEMLEEKPIVLDTQVKQQAMLAITSMSRAGLLLQGKVSSLLQACFSSVFCVPALVNTQGPEAFLYSKTLATMDNMLQELVHSAGDFATLVLQNILQLLLPFTTSHPEEVQERAMARIAQLAAFITTSPLLQLCSCFARAVIFRHECSPAHRFDMLGELVGHLTFCSTCHNTVTSRNAAEALYHLHTFILQQRGRSSRLPDTGLLQLQPCGEALQSWKPLQVKEACEMFSMFVKYLQPSHLVDITLMAIKNMKKPGQYSSQLSIYVVDTLVSEPVFQTQHVQTIVWAIYENWLSTAGSLEGALLKLTDKYLSKVVASLLQCSPTCTSVAVIMWRVMLAKAQTAEKVLEELLSRMMSQSLRKTSTSIREGPRILSLAATRTISEILLQEAALQEVKGIFPQLFLALLFQTTFTAELTLQEVNTFWREHQQDQLTPIRSAVRSMRLLLYRMGYEGLVLDIEEQGGWDILLSAQTHLMGVRIIAREMTKTSTSVCSTIFCCLSEHLSVEDPTWGMVAMVFYVEMLGYPHLFEEVENIMDVLLTHLQSQCPGMPSLLLEGILKLAERPDSARRTLVLLPHIMEQLQGADSDASKAALPVLAAMLPMLDRKTSIVTTLHLADKLWTFFDNESHKVQEFSICLFQNGMSLLAGTKENKTMRKKVWDSLLPLVFHLHDQNKSVVMASQEALCRAGQFLQWEKLKQLAKTGQGQMILECLLARKNRTQDYLLQSQHYLQSPQELLRCEAVRFIGLIGRHVEEQQKREHIRRVLQGAKNDPELLVSSLASQTLHILEAVWTKSRPKLQRLRFSLQRAWRRCWHSSPSEVSAEAETQEWQEPELQEQERQEERQRQQRQQP